MPLPWPRSYVSLLVRSGANPAALSAAGITAIATAAAKPMHDLKIHEAVLRIVMGQSDSSKDGPKGDAFHDWELSASWNNVGVGRLRAARGANGLMLRQAEQALLNAIIVLPQNRLARLNLDLVRDAINLKHDEEEKQTGPVDPISSPWCRDDETIFPVQLSGASSAEIVSCAAAKALGACQTPGAPPGAASHQSANTILPRQLLPAASRLSILDACQQTCRRCGPALLADVRRRLGRQWWLSKRHGKQGGSASSNATVPTTTTTSKDSGRYSHLDLGDDRCDFDTREVSSLSFAEFSQRYVRGRRPLRIRGLGKDWAAFGWGQKWAEWEDSADSHGNAAEGTPSSATPSTTAAPTSAAAAARWVFERLALANAERRNFYLNLDKSPSRLAAVRAGILDAYSSTKTGARTASTDDQDAPPPPIRNPEDLTGEDLLAAHCFADLPSRWLLVSGAGTGSSWHVDPLNTSAWNTLVSGSKRWAVFRGDAGGGGRGGGGAEEEEATKPFPPGLEPPLLQDRQISYFPRDGDKDATPATLSAAAGQGWWGITAPWSLPLPTPFEYFIRARSPDPSLQQCMQRAGDTIFVPSGFWHTVLNVEAANVAFTHNFASLEIIDEVARELQKRPDGTVPRRCLEQLRQAGHAAVEPKTLVANSSRHAPVVNRIPAQAIKFHLLLFLAADDGPNSGSANSNIDVRLQEAADLIESAFRGRAAVICVGSQGPEARSLRRAFQVSDGVPTVLAVETGLVRLTYMSASFDTTEKLEAQDCISCVVTTWMESVIGGKAQPALTKEDRAALAAIYRDLQGAL